jgi:hypothetical protein
VRGPIPRIMLSAIQSAKSARIVVTSKGCRRGGAAIRTRGLYALTPENPMLNPAQ